MLQVSLLCLILYVQYSNATHTSDEEDDLTLNLVQVIFRHGLRTPLEREANILNITDPSFYGYDDFGQLTEEGREQEYLLGKLLRKYYNDHLGVYNRKKLVARSTNVPRTRESLELLLTGLFSRTSVPYEIPEMKNGETDIILSPYMSPKFKSINKSILRSSIEFQKKLLSYTKFVKYLEYQTGHSYFPKILNVCGWTASLIQIHKLLNIPLPSWCTDEVYETSRSILRLYFESLSLNTQLKKLNGGTLIRRVIENVEQNTRRMKKIYLYSTHDTTLTSFMNAQDVVGAFKLPPFGSAYIVESYKDMKHKYYIRMLSWNGSSDQFVELEISNCEKYCPIDKYKILVEDVIPTDEELTFFNLDTAESCGTQL
ncbi:venom acid phosphatase Acph-1-like [Copidosoma floridanum]|uniref:venom acid phosphatase Acph-1-like n=1 Tax=Copidosoma floridanum TaxID=29053 RepID=UPI0006C9AEB8|nr:venom acid phosphatase Acph-1-like [Copidosoma floridanum]